ncbi:hypothetical protein ThidrDRAFT_3976 [Thiorhodococcus drewsii AZ1]|uniref:Uncharacterized protein n=1 Tax=Thiorhodococcus drewsii AZ1 TaxID=765913 RepID=G2E6R3_9GAMM|nr:hypothetical protein [Thiorhodococcus drewsii]EGV28210.1 hypothetical protein ThidrDRAFT_3976 [Thiorhodococcus drewsii AZ1]
MKNPEYAIAQRWASRVLLPALCLATSLAHADVEPNDSCPSADRVELSSMPTTLNGTLEAFGSGMGDIDFYRISATPETPVQITLEGDSEHTDAVGDPSCLTKTGESEYSVLSKKESQALTEVR